MRLHEELQGPRSLAVFTSQNLKTAVVVGGHSLRVVERKGTDNTHLSPKTLCCFLQEAVEENEQRKKQEQAMREKLLAQEAKQHDPKVCKSFYTMANSTI